MDQTKNKKIHKIMNDLFIRQISKSTLKQKLMIFNSTNLKNKIIIR